MGCAEGGSFDFIVCGRNLKSFSGCKRTASAARMISPHFPEISAESSRVHPWTSSVILMRLLKKLDRLEVAISLSKFFVEGECQNDKSSASAELYLRRDIRKLL